MTVILPAHALETARLCAAAARAATLPHFRTRTAVEDKSDDSPVTVADQGAERAMRAIIAQHHPDHDILGEEYGGTSTNRRHWTWVIDPIDGTRAFITGRPSFTTLIALLYDGRPVLGLIDQPVTGERWIGIEGQRTTFEARTMPGEIGTRPCRALDRAELSCTSPDMLAPPFDDRFASLKRTVRRTSWGGDAYGYGLLALGQIDLVAECTMKPWDWAALVPVVTGAGGSMTDWAGAPLSLDGDGTVLACGDPAMHADAIAALSPRATIR